MKKTRKSYSPSFKTKVVLEMLTETKSISEISSEHGIHSTQLHRWRKEFLEKAPLNVKSKVYHHDGEKVYHPAIKFVDPCVTG